MIYIGNNDRRIGNSSKEMHTKGDNTEPCLTLNLIWKVAKSALHLIHEKQFCNRNWMRQRTDSQCIWRRHGVTCYLGPGVLPRRPCVLRYFVCIYMPVC